jgi:S-adenosylmethionine/arginine decarboxylase-like enzyme
VSDRWSRLTLSAAGEPAPDLVLQALAEMSLDLVGSYRVRWQPQGLTWCGWGRDFRLIIHTWPEHGLATLDLWLSARKSEPVIVALELALGWRRVQQDEISRGSLDRARRAPCGDA